MTKVRSSLLAIPLILPTITAEALIVTVSEPIPVVNRFPPLSQLYDGPLVRYDVTFSSDDGIAKVTAFDVEFVGIMHQAQSAGFSLPPGEPTPTRFHAEMLGPNGVAIDSHFVVPVVFPGYPTPNPTEGLIPNLIQLGGSGLGRDLIGNPLAIVAEFQAPSVLAAQIVLAPGTNVVLHGTVMVEGNPDSEMIPLDTIIGVPEPSGLILVGLGLSGVFSGRFFRSSGPRSLHIGHNYLFDKGLGKIEKLPENARNRLRCPGPSL